MKTVALIALLFLNVTVRSQSVSSSVINSTGNSFSQGHYNVDWSVGEMSLVGSMHSNGEILVLTNGFLQPGSPDADSSTRRRFTDSEVKIFPNPTHGKVEVNFATSQAGTLILCLYDANGKLIKTDRLFNNGIMISRSFDLSSFSSGTYFLKIELNASKGSVSKTGSYKIIKL